MQNFFRAKAFLNHWLDAVDEHSLHSPFFFDFYSKVIKAKSDDSISGVEKTRDQLLSNHSHVQVKDLGASSPYFNTSDRTVAQVASTSLNKERQCALFLRIIKYFNAKNILELGTSMGVTTLYLAKNEGTKVTTFEGNPDMINIALTNFEYFKQKNITLIKGNIDETLHDYLQNPAKIDFALIDANHRYEPTVRYFNLLARRMGDHGVMVIDDIYYSEEMARAWNEIKKHDLVYGSIDLYRCGILFFDLNLNKQHFIWSY